MVTGLQEVGCLVVFIQNFNLEVGKSRQGVAIVLLSLNSKLDNLLLLTSQKHYHTHFTLLDIKNKQVSAARQRMYVCRFLPRTLLQMRPVSQRGFTWLNKGN